MYTHDPPPADGPLPHATHTLAPTTTLPPPLAPQSRERAEGVSGLERMASKAQDDQVGDIEGAVKFSEGPAKGPPAGAEGVPGPPANTPTATSTKSPPRSKRPPKGAQLKPPPLPPPPQSPSKSPPPPKRRPPRTRAVPLTRSESNDDSALMDDRGAALMGAGGGTVELEGGEEGGAAAAGGPMSPALSRLRASTGGAADRGMRTMTTSDVLDDSHAGGAFEGASL